MLPTFKYGCKSWHGSICPVCILHWTSSSFSCRRWWWAVVIGIWIIIWYYFCFSMHNLCWWRCIDRWCWLLLWLTCSHCCIVNCCLVCNVIKDILRLWPILSCSAAWILWAMLSCAGPFAVDDWAVHEAWLGGGNGDCKKWMEGSDWWELRNSKVGGVRRIAPWNGLDRYFFEIKRRGNPSQIGLLIESPHREVFVTLADAGPPKQNEKRRHNIATSFGRLWPTLAIIYLRSSPASHIMKDLLPVPDQLSKQLAKCKSIRDADTYYKSRDKTPQVGHSYFDILPYEFGLWCIKLPVCLHVLSSIDMRRGCDIYASFYLSWVTCGGWLVTKWLPAHHCSSLTIVCYLSSIPLRCIQYNSTKLYIFNFATMVVNRKLLQPRQSYHQCQRRNKTYQI